MQVDPEKVWNVLYIHATRLFKKWRVHPQDVHDLAMDAATDVMSQELKPGVTLERMVHCAATKLFRKWTTRRKLQRLLTNVAIRGYWPATRADKKVFSEECLVQPG